MAVWCQEFNIAAGASTAAMLWRGQARAGQLGDRGAHKSRSRGPQAGRAVGRSKCFDAKPTVLRGQGVPQQRGGRVDGGNVGHRRACDIAQLDDRTHQRL